jgi:hypothetical protein
MGLKSKKELVKVVLIEWRNMGDDGKTVHRMGLKTYTRLKVG